MVKQQRVKMSCKLIIYYALLYFFLLKIIKITPLCTNEHSF